MENKKTGLKGLKSENQETKEKGEMMEKAKVTANMENLIKSETCLGMEKLEKEVSWLTSEVVRLIDRGEGMEAQLKSENREKTEGMETGSVKVEMVKGMVKEYFSEFENQDGSEIWEEMSVVEIKEDLAIWLKAYGPGGMDKTETPETLETPDGMVKGMVNAYFEEFENQDGSEVWEGMEVTEIREDLAIWLKAYGS